MEITNISNTNPTNFINQNYTSKDESLLNSLVIDKEFGQPEDKVEIHIISPNGELLDSIYDFRNYTTRSTIEGSSLYNTIELDPKNDLLSFGYGNGRYDIVYYFYRQLFNSSESNKFYITEISPDRTEIKISNNNVSYNELGQSYLNFITTRNSRPFYSDFLLNYGDNKTYIGVNIALDNINTNLPSLYIKLYEPLPPNFKIKDTFWLVESISEPHSFNVNTEFIAEAISDSIPLRGPNLSIELAEKNNITTPYLNLSSLLDPSTSSSYQQLQSWLEEKSIEITVDYNDFSNFIHFSSAQERLENFKYKLNQIQSLQSDINSLEGLNPLTSVGYIAVSKNSLQSRIDSIITTFDGYEYFLYFESGSNSWPKTNSEKPYINDTPTSIPSKTWFGSTDYTSTYYGGKILDANNYDVNNRDYIWNNFPEYIKEDSQNSNLELFVAMMGQHYDYIWTYAKDITDLSVADNRIDHGISKDLVADTLRNFGINLYTNSRNQDDLYLSLLGMDSNYNTLPSTGSLIIENYVTSSQYTIPSNDITKETYKRIYHNLPYLLKTKGTRRGLYSLINCFGIPETILKIKEFGGSKKDQNLIEQFNEKFNYSLKNSNLSIPFDYSKKQLLDTGNIIFPDTLEFRFKLDVISPTQSLLETGDSWKRIRVTHTTGSYSTIDFGLSNDDTFIYSPSIELPLYNGDWWTLNLTRETGSIDISQTGSNQTYILTIGNKDDKGIQNYSSTSLTIDGSTQGNYNFRGWNNENPLNISFTGSIQEFRYWIGSIPTNDFKDHILNPQSIVCNGVTGSYDNLIFRLPLGSELDNNLQPVLTSVHPSPTSSFIGGSTGSLNSGTYVINHELFLVNTPNIGSITEIDEKVRISTPNLIPGDVLTPYTSIQKPEEYPYTKDLNIVEVAISPQDSINEDIISQLGSFNIDDYIGDPRLDSLNTYPSLDILRNFYFQKYSKSQNIFDVIKLLSYFDNSLFKMIKDFVPAKSNLSTGLVIKSNILERNKIPRQEPTLTFVDHSGSIETSFMVGSNGLDLDLNTDHTTTTTYLTGNIEKHHTDKVELFNGELGGTIITVHSQSLENVIYELNHISVSSSQDIHDNFYRLPINPTLNNVYLPRTSPKYLDVDYSYNPITPVNSTFLNSVLFQNLNTTQYPFLHAPIQDSNYTLKRHIDPRYNGSKTTSALYNIHTIGDTSYGSTAAIDYHSVKFAYFTEITSQSSTLNGRSNINIKYLIDSASNVIELTEANKNVFDVQNIFSKGKVNIALENINKPSKQKSLNGLKSIYAGGFRYEPILLNNSTPVTNHSSLDFTFNEPISYENPNTGSQVTENIIGGIVLGQYSLGTSISSNYINTFTSPLISTLNSTIMVDVVRNTSYQGEIRQKVTGNIKVTIKVSTSEDYTTKLYNNYSGTGIPRWTQIGPRVTGWLGDLPSTDPLYLTQDSVGSVLIEPGVTLKIANDQDPFRVVSNTGNTNLLVTGPPLVINSNGINRVEISRNDTQCYFTTSDINNSFGSNPTFTLGYGPHNVTGTDSLVLETTFPIEGIVILGENEGNTGGPAVSVPLRTISNEIGTIRTVFNFTKTSTSPNIALKSLPLVGLNSITTLNNPYYLTDSPSILYITGTVDYGFLSGSNNPSGSEYNWYFERGNSSDVGSKFTYLTASYDLSKLYYNNISGYVTTPNYFTQNLPTESLSPTGSFEPIYDNFFPKKGDLVKFYNHERKIYPFSPEFEREIINIYPPLSSNIGTGSNGTGSYDNRLVFEVSNNDIPNQACSDLSRKILNFIFLSKVEDETNVIISHEKQIGQTSAGILLPSNISTKLKNESGNIVKSLKSQNLV